MNQILDLESVRAFLQVADAGGFSRAAGLAYSTQPTLSRQVAALEKIIQHKLFDRSARKVLLTPFGEEFVPRARALLAQAQGLTTSPNMSLGKLAGQLRIGAADSVVLGRLPGILRAFLKAHPAVDVQVHTASSPKILAAVREERADCGLCMLPRAFPGLRFEPLWRDPFVALVPTDHALAGKRAKLSEFAAQPQIVISPDALAHQFLSAAFQDAGLALIPHMSFDAFSLVTNFIAAGLGVGISTASVAQAYLRSGQVARVRIGEIDMLERNLGLVLPMGKTASPALLAFLGKVRRRG